MHHIIYIVDIVQFLFLKCTISMLNQVQFSNQYQVQDTHSFIITKPLILEIMKATIDLDLRIQNIIL